MRKRPAIEALLTFAPAGGTSILAPFVVRRVPGPAFAAGALVLRAAAPVLCLAGVNTVLGMELLLPRGRRRAFLPATAIPGLLSLSERPFVGRAQGAVGVAPALSVTQLCATLVGVVFRYRRGAFGEMSSAARDPHAATRRAPAGPGRAWPSGPVPP